jgi:phage terminase large subunit
MKRRIQVTRIYERNADSGKPIIVNVGGARSSKSYSILQLLVQKFVSEPRKTILIARKTLPSLKLTAYGVFVDLLKDYGYYDQCTHNRTNLTIEYRDSKVHFMSIDDPEKIKSAEFNYVFLEEANEFTYLDFMILKMRMSAPTIDSQPNRMYLALNPSEEFSWINQKVVHWDNVETIKSTYHDNPFLSKEYTESLEDLKEIDPELYKIYALGEYAALSNIIYRNYIEAPCDGTFDDEWFGLDTGFTVPTALVWVGRRGGQIYVKEMLYQDKLTNSDLIDEMGQLGIDTRTPIYTDSAEPARIEEIYRAGYNVYPAEKKVDDGIDHVKRHRLHIDPSSANLLKEIRTYKWREDKNGNMMDEPVKFNDHAVDALRYAIHTHLIDETKQAVFIPRGR